CCSFFFFSSRRRHTRFSRDWSSDVCSSDLRLKTFRNLGQLLTDLLQRLERYGGLAAALLICLVSRAQSRPRAVQPVRLVRLVGLAGFKFVLQLCTPFGAHLVDLCLRDQPFLDQLVAIELRR